MHLLKLRTLTMFLIAIPAFLLGLTTLCSAQINGISALTVSDTNPISSEPVTLTATVSGGSSGWSGVVYFFEDPGVLLNANPNPDLPIYKSGGNNNSIVLGSYPVSGAAGNTQDTATLTMSLLGGAHKVYAYVERTQGTQNYTTSDVLINVAAAIAVPAAGAAYLGAATGGRAGSSTTGDTDTPKLTMDTAESAATAGIGRPYALAIKYYTGLGSLTPFNQLASEVTETLEGTTEVYSFAPGEPDVDLTDDLENGRIPTISWRCDTTWKPATGDTAGYSGADEAIANWDDLEGDITTIQETAEALKLYGGPVMLRLDWEFNIFSNAGACAGVTKSGGAPNWTTQNYDNFVGAWQTIWQIFQQQGATNVVFDWNPGDYVDGLFDTAKADPQYMYPGDTFVDWIGLDSYQDQNWTPTPWTLANAINGEIGGGGNATWYTDYHSHNKPMMVGETGAYNQSYAVTAGKTCDPASPCPPFEVQGAYIGSIQTLFDNDSATYPLLHAVEWFDESASLLDYGDSGYADAAGITAMYNLGKDSSTFHNSQAASAAPSTPNSPSSSYPMPLRLSNTGLLPLTNVKITSISNVSVLDGSGTVTAPAAGSPNFPILFPNPNIASTYSNLEAGQTATTVTPAFTWPTTATCVSMTIHYSASKSNDLDTTDGGGTETFTGSNSINVARQPGDTCP